MKPIVSCVAGALVLGLLVAPSSVPAQVVANGPYYAVPSWDMTLPAAQRFVVLANMNHEAVLDRETGLVWERAPDDTRMIWPDARRACTGRTTGGRKGWRLPSVHELASLVDPSVAATFPDDVSLPQGHPFTTSVPVAAYWSATTDAQNPDQAWFVLFNGGSGLIGIKSVPGAGHAAWCVRGASNADTY
jgi:hypothetical protein